MTDSDGWLERYGETHSDLTYPVPVTTIGTAIQ